MFAVPAVENPLQEIFYRNVPLSSMIEMQKAFAQEISIFFTAIFQSWIDNSKPFPQYDLLINLETARYFSIHVRKAVITIAYLLRREFWKVFRNKKRSMEYSKDDQNSYFTDFTVCNNHCLLQFLIWVAYLFELATYSFTEKQNYLKQCIWCLENYTNIFKFHIDGGWEILNEFSVYFGSFYDLLDTFIGKSYPDSDIIVPLSKAIHIVERHEGYERKILQVKMKRNLVNSVNTIPPKVRALLKFNPKRIRLGHISTKTVSSDKLKIVQELSFKAVELPSISQARGDVEPKKQEHASYKLNVGKTTFCTPLSINGKRENHKANVPDVRRSLFSVPKDDSKSEQLKVNDPGNVPPELNCTNYIFLVSNRFLEKRKLIESNAEKSKFKRDIKIYSPTMKREIRIENLKDILDENIKNSNHVEITDGIYTVCPAEWDDEDENLVIALNTSSEEDDNDSLDIFQQSFMNYTVQKMKECRNFNNIIVKTIIEEVTKNDMFAQNKECDRSGSSQRGEFNIESNRDRKKLKKKVQQRKSIQTKSIQNINYEADSEDSQIGNPWRIYERRTPRKIKRRRKTRNMPRFREVYTAHFQNVS